MILTKTIEQTVLSSLESHKTNSFCQCEVTDTQSSVPSFFVQPKL